MSAYKDALLDALRQLGIDMVALEEQAIHRADASTARFRRENHMAERFEQGQGMGIMRDRGAVSAAPNMPNSEVRALVMGLNHDLEGLASAISELEERLGIALTPDAPTPTSPMNQTVKERASSSLGQDIEQLRAVLENHTRKLQSIRFRVAL